jgi:hypothetical protein
VEFSLKVWTVYILLYKEIFFGNRGIKMPGKMFKLFRGEIKPGPKAPPKAPTVPQPQNTAPQAQETALAGRLEETAAREDYIDGKVAQWPAEVKTRFRKQVLAEAERMAGHEYWNGNDWMEATAIYYPKAEVKVFEAWKKAQEARKCKSYSAR